MTRSWVALWLVIAATACTPLRPLDPVGSGGADGSTRDAGSGGAPSDGGCAASDLCDGIDDDCDPATADGAGDPRVGLPCDGPDTDLCEEGHTVCVGGEIACDDATDDDVEVCSASRDDEDCDGEVDEAEAVGATTFYRDDDGDGFGDAAVTITACEPPDGWVARTGDCDDRDDERFPGAPERCNALDDDCDGDRDELACAPCEVTEHTGTHRYYLHCPVRNTWSGARTYCGSRGYELLRIDDDEENHRVQSFIRSLMARTGAGGVWLALRRSGTRFLWTDGTEPTYTDFGAGEPSGGDCVISNGSRWLTAPCSSQFAVICRAR